jgi:hypothetical protein
MPNATITSSVFTGDGTQAGLLTALNTAMLSAGFTSIDSFAVTGNEQRVWEFDADPSDVSFGKMIIQGGFSATTTMRVQGYSSFTPVADTGSNVSSTTTTSGLALASNFTFYICNHPEIRGVIMQEGSTFEKFFGYVRPATKPPNWGNFPFGFIDSGTAAFASSNLQSISSLRPAIVGVSSGCGGYVNNGGSALELWGNRPFLTNCLLHDITNTRAISFFSNDIVSVGTSGMSILQQFNDPVSGATYTIFDNPSTSLSRIAIKTAGA